MMCWSWIDSSHKREASKISCSGQRPFGGARLGLDKNRENNPMQSRVDPGSQHSCCAASGPREEKGPSLISSRSKSRNPLLPISEVQVCWGSPLQSQRDPEPDVVSLLSAREASRAVTVHWSPSERAGGVNRRQCFSRPHLLLHHRSRQQSQTRSGFVPAAL